MSAFHATREGEELALGWHQFGKWSSRFAAWASAACTIFCGVFAAFLLLMALTLPLPAVGVFILIFGALLGLAATVGHAACTVNAAAGVFWHRKAEGDHREAIAVLASKVDA